MHTHPNHYIYKKQYFSESILNIYTSKHRYENLVSFFILSTTKKSNNLRNFAVK